MRLLPTMLHCGLLCLAAIALPPSRTSADARSSPRRSDDKVTTPKPSTDPTSSSTSYSASLSSSTNEGTVDSSASDLYFPDEEEEQDKKSRMSPLRTALIVAVPVIAVAGFVTVTIVVAAVLIHKKKNKGFSLSYYKPSNELSILIDYGPHANFNPISYKYHDPEDLDTEAVVIHEYDVAANRYDHDRRGDAASKTSRYAHTRPATKTEADSSEGVHGTNHRTTVHDSGVKRARPHSDFNQLLLPGVAGVVKDLRPSSAEPADDSAGRRERGGANVKPLPKPRLHGEQAEPTVTQRQSVLERWLIG